MGCVAFVQPHLTAVNPGVCTCVCAAGGVGFQRGMQHGGRTNRVLTRAALGHSAGIRDEHPSPSKIPWGNGDRYLSFQKPFSKQVQLGMLLILIKESLITRKSSFLPLTSGPIITHMDSC